jgi:hypothetical protein
VKLSEAVFDVPAQASFFFKKKNGSRGGDRFPRKITQYYIDKINNKVNFTN